MVDTYGTAGYDPAPCAPVNSSRCYSCFPSAGWLPALGIVYRHNPRHALFAQYSQAIRLPSYTEYNYNNPASLGDQGLERQQTRTAELGWQWAGNASRAEVTTFAEAGGNSVE